MSRISHITLACIALAVIGYSANIVFNWHEPSPSVVQAANPPVMGGNAPNTPGGNQPNASQQAPVAPFGAGINTSTQSFQQTTQTVPNSAQVTTVTPNGTTTNFVRTDPLTPVTSLPQTATTVVGADGRAITTVQTNPNQFNNGFNNGFLPLAGGLYPGYGMGGGYLQGGVTTGPTLNGVVTQGANPNELGLYASSSQVSGHVFTGALGEQTTMYPADYLHRTGTLGPLSQQEAATWNRMNNNRQVYGPMSLIRGSGSDMQPTVVASKDVLVDGIPQRVSGSIIMETADAPLVSTNQFEMERSRQLAMDGALKSGIASANTVRTRSAWTRIRSGWSRAQWEKNRHSWAETHR